MLISLSTLIAIAVLTLKSCQNVSDNYEAHQRELDRLCGRDRSGCIATTEVVPVPHFDGSAGYTVREIYSTLTPTPKRK